MRVRAIGQFGLVTAAVVSCAAADAAPMHGGLPAHSNSPIAYTGAPWQTTLLSMIEQINDRRGGDRFVDPFVNGGFGFGGHGSPNGNGNNGSVAGTFLPPSGAPTPGYVPPPSIGGRDYDPMVPVGPNGWDAGPDDGTGGAPGNMQDEVAIPNPVPLPTPFSLTMLGGIAVACGVSSRRSRRSAF